MAIFGDFFASVFQRAARSMFQTCILICTKAMCGSMVDIQSPTAEIRQGKKEETTGQKYDVRI